MLSDTDLTDDEGDALLSEFMVDELFGACRCADDEGCPLCDNDKLDEWLRKRRMAALGLRVINGGLNGTNDQSDR